MDPTCSPAVRWKVGDLTLYACPEAIFAAKLVSEFQNVPSPDVPRVRASMVNPNIPKLSPETVWIRIPGRNILVKLLWYVKEDGEGVSCDMANVCEPTLLCEPAVTKTALVSDNPDAILQLSNVEDNHFVAIDAE